MRVLPESIEIGSNRRLAEKCQERNLTIQKADVDVLALTCPLSMEQRGGDRVCGEHASGLIAGRGRVVLWTGDPAA